SDGRIPRRDARSTEPTDIAEEVEQDIGGEDTQANHDETRPTGMVDRCHTGKAREAGRGVHDCVSSPISQLPFCGGAATARAGTLRHHHKRGRGRAERSSGGARLGPLRPDPPVARRRWISASEKEKSPRPVAGPGGSGDLRSVLEWAP